MNEDKKAKDLRSEVGKKAAAKDVEMIQKSR
jgi:hypothetical protein